MFIRRQTSEPRSADDGGDYDGDDVFFSLLDHFARQKKQKLYIKFRLQSWILDASGDDEGKPQVDVGSIEKMIDHDLLKIGSASYVWEDVTGERSWNIDGALGWWSV